ncbi:SMP-30/gluconolactonase/LRE family protein [Ferrimonas futtsuensis]|uniref:SMP-30/gluconolactonase/LRE family protein n=1 Tax=Ferrimonas futtsuensis TaxID=364764 RepID=UPI0009FC26C1|nr:SMP-30/gluconolactonase/LRE family protein [Ferrimonas futtsuensis]
MNLVSKKRCILGEGIFLNREIQVVCWLDIEKSTLYSLGYSSKLIDEHEVFLDDKPSAIISLEGDSITFLSKKGICKYLNGATEVLRVIPELEEKEHFRCNDGVLLADGRIVFGTMSETNTKDPGHLYIYSPIDDELFKKDQIHIPNGFIELDDGILISDSLKQVIYKYDKSLMDKKVWLDLSDGHLVPDGGTVGQDGKVYICMWDGFCINVYSKDAILQRKIKVPVQRPTNCAEDNGTLFYTSASIDMSDSELSKSPLSGKLLTVELGEASV